MEHKKRINETNFMRRMMGLQPINERYDIDAAEQKQMQLVSNVMTPEGYSQPGGISTVPFKDSEEGKEWAAGDKKVLSPDRLEYATNTTIENSGEDGWEVEKTGYGVIIKDVSRDFFSVETVANGNPNWTYVIRAGSGFPDEEKDADFDVSPGSNVYGKVLNNYEEYATFLEGILHKHSPMVSPSKPSPSASSSWCKRDLDIDWYFDKLKIGKGYLKKGDCGEAVEVAQDFINEYEGSEVIEVDGKYGNDTIGQVKVSQNELDLKGDGYYGQKTHDALIRAIGAGKGAPDQPEDDMERIDPKPVKMIDTDIDTDIDADIDTDIESDFDFDSDVKGVGVDIDIKDIEAVETEFEKKAKAKAEKRSKKGKRKLNRIGKRSSKLKKRYNFEEQKTFKVKKNGKVITLTESDVKKIINLKK